ncbi:hypothetical protein F5Y01DRAFT_311269 [Xylaria sp. FL0043]|nr:hypothetical protein F5Y01DRAFT_311269 [Xylaria sp. FL0043]
MQAGMIEGWASTHCSAGSLYHRPNEVTSLSLAVPGFVRALQERYAIGTWGSVILRNAGYDMSPKARKGQCKRIDAAICAPLKRHLDVDGVEDTRECFRLERV